METKMRKYDKGHVLEVHGRLDQRVALELEEKLSDALERSEGRLIVDLCGAEFIDSTVLGVLVILHRAAEERRAVFILVVPDSPAKQVFTATGTEDFFSLYPSIEEALEAA